MIAKVNSSAETADQSLKTARSAGGLSGASQAGSQTADAVNNEVVDSFFDRARSLPDGTSGDFGDISTGESADQYMQYARTSILERPASTMAVQANQLPQTVLQLLN
jgi:hypothetical protein